MVLHQAMIVYLFNYRSIVRYLQSVISNESMHHSKIYYIILLFVYTNIFTISRNNTILVSNESYLISSSIISSHHCLHANKNDRLRSKMHSHVRMKRWYTWLLDIFLYIILIVNSTIKSVRCVHSDYQSALIKNWYCVICMWFHWRIDKLWKVCINILCKCSINRRNKRR